MDKLRAIELYVEIVRHGSFSAAARKQRISRATASKMITALESEIGARLLVRTTQQVNPTEAGLALLRRAEPLVSEYRLMLEEVHNVNSSVSGEIHLGTPPSFGSFHLIPAIASFQSQFPQIKIFLHSDYGRTDLVKSGLDLSVRISSQLTDSSLVLKLLGRVPQLLIASPAYLAKAAKPHHPSELANHNCLVHLLSAPESVWTFTSGTEEVQVFVDGNIKSELGESIRSSTLAGLGISLHPAFMVANDIHEGRLIHLLTAWSLPHMSIQAVYPSNRHLPTRTRMLLDFLRDWFFTRDNFR
jgi:DNA-binding transcriptional LysR family regulator